MKKSFLGYKFRHGFLFVFTRADGAASVQAISQGNFRRIAYCSQNSVDSDEAE